MRHQVRVVVLVLLNASLVAASNVACVKDEVSEESLDVNVLMQKKVQTIASSEEDGLTGASREESQDAATNFKPKGKGKKKKKDKKARHEHTNNMTNGSHNPAVVDHHVDPKALELAIGIIVALFMSSFCCMAWAGSGHHFNFDLEKEDTDNEPRSSETLDEDTYGLAVSLLVRDTAVLADGEGNPVLRQCRFALVFLLVFINKGLQVFLLFQVLQYVTPAIIKSSRKNYDLFEWHMYGQTTSHLTVLSDGTRRGLPEFFQPELFDSLTQHVKNQVCHIPFSQPSFFIIIIFVWSLTCIGDLRKAVDMFSSLITHTPTVKTLQEIVKPLDPTSERQSHRKLIVGLTWQMKVFITSIILIPRIILTCILLWLGSRWLAATNDFGDLIMNTVALEFILLLQNLLYMTIVPARNKRDCQSIETVPPYSHEPAGIFVFAASFLWGLVALAWAVVYTYYVQQVLPGYNWDVRDVCSHWLQR